MKIRFAAVFLFALLFLFLTACAPEERYTETLPILPSDTAAYSQAAVDTAVSTLYTAVRQAVGAEALSRALPPQAYLREAVLAFQARGVPEGEMLSAVARLAEAPSLWQASGSDADAGLFSLVGLFRTLVRGLGNEAASSLVYDICGIYCRYTADFNMSLYQKENGKYPTFKAEAELWIGYKESLSAVGKENFACLLRLTAALATLTPGGTDGAGGAEGMLRGLSDGELLLLLKTEATLLSELELTAADMAFLLRFLSHNGDSYLIDGVVSADETARCAEGLVRLLPLVGELLLRMETADLALIREGSTSAFAYTLCHRLSRAELDTLLSCLDGEKPAEAYRSFLERKGLWQAYEALPPADTAVTAEELWQASPEEFLEKCKQYVNQTSQITVFLMQKDWERNAE